jgi:hypothetical protein
MRHELAKGDHGPGPIRERGSEIGQIGRDRLVQGDDATLCQPHRCSSDEGLADRGQAKDRILAHSGSSLPIREAGGPMINDLAIAGRQDHGAHDATLAQRPFDRKVHAAGECGHAAT